MSKQNLVFATGSPDPFSLGVGERRFISIDPAVSDSDYTVGSCPTCRMFQEMVSPDYVCKSCGIRMIENIILK